MRRWGGSDGRCDEGSCFWRSAWQAAVARRLMFEGVWNRVGGESVRRLSPAGADAHEPHSFEGEKLGEPALDVGADLDTISMGGGIMAVECWALMDDPSKGTLLLFLLEFGLLCMRECLVNSSDRLKRLVQPGNWQMCGFSPVWVRICLVWCSSRWNALSQSGHL